MKWELAEALSNLHPLALAIVGESVFNNRTIILIDDIMLSVACGEDNQSTHSNSGLDKRRGGDILGIYQCRINSTECNVCSSLSYGMVVFGWYRIAFIFCTEVAGNFTFSLRVYRRNKLWRGGLLVLASNLQSRPSFVVGNHQSRSGVSHGSDRNSCIAGIVSACGGCCSCRTGIHLPLHLPGIFFRQCCYGCHLRMLNSSLVREDLLL